MSDTEAPEQQQGAEAEQPAAQQPAKAPQLPGVTSKKLQKLQEKYDKRGIVYISRIPPHLVRKHYSLQCNSEHAREETIILLRRPCGCLLLPPVLRRRCLRHR